MYFYVQWKFIQPLSLPENMRWTNLTSNMREKARVCKKFIDILPEIKWMKFSNFKAMSTIYKRFHRKNLTKIIC